MLNSTPIIDRIERPTGSGASEQSSPLSVVSIEKIVAGGLGLGRIGPQVVLVRGGIPGEQVRVHLGNKRRGVHQAEILNIMKSSADRIEPPCCIAGQCGGCQFQHQTYQSQILHKRIILQDALWRISKLPVPNIPEVVPSPWPFHYRTTVRFVVFRGSRGFQLGFYKQGTRIPIRSHHCLLVPEAAEELVSRVSGWLSAQRTLPIFLDSLEVRWSEFLRQGLLIFRGRGRRMPPVPASLEVLGSLNGTIGSVLEFTQSQGNYGTRTSLVLSGEDHIIERFHELTLRIGHRSFLQANWPVYEALGERLSEWSDDLRGLRILELYAGVGALGLMLARRGAKVTMVEKNPFALADARRSAALNHVGRCRFRSDSAETYLSTTNKGDYEAVIVDPPRAGLSPMTIRELGRVLVPRLFYVSCDPATLARDLSRLGSFGYKIARIQPFDMFPQTAHIETLVELTL